MANPLAIALALYGGYKGYKAGKERGGTAGGIIGGILGAAGGYYGGQSIGGSLGLQNVAGTQGFTNAMMSPFKNMGAVKAAEVGGAGYGGGGYTAADLARANTITSGQQVSPGFLTSAKEFAKKNPGFTLGTAAGLGAYASGAFEPEPYKRTQFTYNVAYPDLYRNRQFFVQDPKTGETVQQEQLSYIPEENEKFVGQDRFGPYGMATKTMNTGGLVEIAKFNEGGMPVKSTHDEKDMNNYKRTNGYVADHTDGANKDEDTILAQLADGEFVTRTDGILGAGILMGASPKDEKDMRKKGAQFFYDQQKKMKRLYDLFNKAEKNLTKIGIDVMSVKKDEVDRYWGLLKLMITHGLKHSGNLMSVDHLKEDIKTGYYQLFIMFGSDDGVETKVFGVFVTRITDHAQKRQCEVVLLAGKQRELWEDQVTFTIEELALANECDRIAILARPGWKKLGDRHGFKAKNIEFVKELKNG